MAPYVIMGSAYCEVLVVTAELLRACIEQNEVVDKFEETRLAAHLDQGSVKQVLNGALLFPSQVVLLWRLNRAVAKALGVVARHDPLHSGKEVLDKHLFLIVEILPDAFGHGDSGTLQLQHAE